MQMNTQFIKVFSSEAQFTELAILLNSQKNGDKVEIKYRKEGFPSAILVNGQEVIKFGVAGALTNQVKVPSTLSFGRDNESIPKFPEMFLWKKL